MFEETSKDILEKLNTIREFWTKDKSPYTLV